MSPIAYPEAPLRRHLAIVAAASLAVVAIVLGWRWSVVSAATDDATDEAAALDPGAGDPPLPGASRPPLPIELEVTVLGVHDVVTADPAPATAAPVEPGPVAATPPPPAEAITASPGRTPPRTKKSQRAMAPARSEAHPEARSEARSDTRGDPPEVKPTPPRTDAPPPKPEAPPRPTMEPNPYLYK